METMKFKTRVGSDGILKLEMPLGLSNQEIEVVMVVQPVEPREQDAKRADWLAFINATAGSLADDPIERGDQGVHEIRDAIG